MFSFIGGIVLAAFIAFLTFYAFDDGFQWKDLPRSLYMPSVKDLKSTDMEAVSSYVESDIIPAARYFEMLRNLSLRDDLHYWMYYIWFLEIPPFFLTMSGAHVLSVEDHTLRGIFTAAILFCVCVVVYFLYKWKFSRPKFVLGETEVARMLVNIRENEDLYPVCRECDALNSDLIQTHFAHLLREEKYIKGRLHVRKTLEIVMGIIFIISLFFCFDP